jgi:hypothetical protein
MEEMSEIEPFGYVYEERKPPRFVFSKTRIAISDDDSNEFEISETPVFDKSQALMAGLNADTVEWVVNDNAELGVKIGDKFFWCYKGESLVYDDGRHDDGTQMLWRHVGKREFGECIHPINYGDLTRIGTVSVTDGREWFPVSALAKAALVPVEQPA